MFKTDKTERDNLDELPPFDDESENGALRSPSASTPLPLSPLLAAACDGQVETVALLASIHPKLLNEALFECVRGRALFEGRMKEAFDEALDNIAETAKDALDRGFAIRELEAGMADVQNDRRHLDVASTLAELGADMDARDSAGATAIILAGRLRAWSIIPELRELGVDVFAFDARGDTIAKIATAAGYHGLDRFFAAAELSRRDKPALEDDEELRDEPPSPSVWPRARKTTWGA